jgi:hypothetical protein
LAKAGFYEDPTRARQPGPETNPTNPFSTGSQTLRQVSRVTSDASLLAFRGLDDVLGLTGLAGEVVADTRTGANSRSQGLFHPQMCASALSIWGMSDKIAHERQPSR